MAASSVSYDFAITAEKIANLVDRIVLAVDPLAVIAFGSRARGDHRPDSDLDLAIIVDGSDENHPRLPDDIRKDLWMSMDLLTISWERFDKFRPWINTVHRQIDRQGVRLYERGRQPADRSAYERLCA